MGFTIYELYKNVIEMMIRRKKGLKIKGLRKVVTIFTVIAMAMTIISISFNSLLTMYLSYKLNNEVGKVSSIGIIGGADGPTAIYLTSQPHPYLFTVIFLLLSIAGALYLFFIRKVIK
ncbi:sodium ion-translocating decarboxylase subunit beta [Tissierella carlieri]|nr:sodium ion-translocating decarboxylase subunit beta [Tissierella carlieri]